MASLSVEDLKKMKVNDLKKELKDRGLTVSGTKDVLLERLEASLTGKPTPAEESTAPVPAPTPAVDTDNVEKSIDQLVGDTAPAPPVQPTADAVTAPSKENIPKPDGEDSAEAKKVVSLKGLSDADKLKARAEKFGGAVSDSAKKMMRAERFGVQAPSTGNTGSIGSTAPVTAPAGDVDKLKKRAERFGMVVSNSLSKVDEDERKRKRLERFGQVATSPTEPKKVKLNSTDNDMEEKKKKRAERFGLT